jgi:tetratricopeptide (TPR) repeat protein
MLGMRLISPARVLPLVILYSQAGAWQPAGDFSEIVRAFYQEDYPRAALLAAKYLKIYPRDSRARIYLARIEMARGNYASAYKKLREVLHSDPRNEDALFYLAKVCGALSQAEFDRLYSLAPDAARVHQLLAESYRVQEKPAEAEQEYRAALAANPRSAEVLVALGDLKRSQSDFDGAIGYYSKAVELEPRNYDAVYGLGVSYSYRQDHARAMELFQRSVAIDPNSAPGRLALANSLIRAGRWEAAIPELKRAAVIEPKMRQAYYLLGQCYQKLGRSGEAQDAFRKVDELVRSEAESARELLNTDDLIPGSKKPQL